MIQNIIFAIPFFGVLSVVFAGVIYKWVAKQENNNKVMAEFSKDIQKGASIYLKRLFQALGGVASVVAVIIFLTLGWKTALAYLLGSILSATAGYLGMYVSTRANAKVAWAARKGIKKAFPVGFFAGAVMGLSVVGVALIGMSVLYIIFRDLNVILGFSFGASSLALLAKAGGGIYTKTADIGADLVGKVENNLAEDDSRNPAVVGDTVGDPFKDTAGPSINTLITVMSLVSIIFAPLIAKFALFKL